MRSKQEIYSLFKQYKDCIDRDGARNPIEDAFNVGLKVADKNPAKEVLDLEKALKGAIETICSEMCGSKAHHPLCIEPTQALAAFAKSRGEK